jgi:hypothetical protein
MTNLARRDERLQKLIKDTISAREKRDDALTKLVKAEVKLRTLEKQQERFKKGTKAIRKRLAVTPPVVPAPERKPAPAPEKPIPAPAPAPAPANAEAKAAALRDSLRGDRKRKQRD